MKIIFHLLNCCLLCSIGFVAQAQLYPLPLNQRIEAAENICIGSLSEQICFRSQVDSQVYTCNLIDVQAYLKGASSQQRIAIITAGGELNGQGRIVFPAVKLRTGQAYLFFLQRAAASHTWDAAEELYPKLVQHQVYGNMQGALPLQAGYFQDIFFESLAGRVMLEQIYQICQETPITPSGERFHLAASSSTNQASRMVTITSVSSLSATGMAAGTIENARIARIQGSGFDPFALGSLGSSVEFSHAADGGASFIGLDYPDTDIILWSDTEIQVKIPGDAGTGFLRLNIFNSPGPVTFPITIDWAVIPQYSRDQAWPDIMRQRLEYVREFNGVNDGYAFQFDTNFWTNTDAIEAFLRAVETWRCNTFINLNFGTAANNAAFVSGNGSQVRFASAASLGAGVLAQAHLRFRNTFSAAIPACIRENTLWYITDMDLLFLDNPTPNSWNFSDNTPAVNAYDFESMSLKMVGLAIGLGYINQANTAMHFELPLGQGIRNLTANEIVAGTHKVTHSITNTACKTNLASNGLMVAVSGTQACVLDWKKEDAVTVFLAKEMPHIFFDGEKMIISVPPTISFPLQVELFDLQGKRIGHTNWQHSDELPLSSNLPSVSQGMYIYRLSNEVTSWSGKWIK